jgi:DNA-binding XRE family transcriptional regulator
MDRRRKMLSPHEQLKLREQLMSEIRAHPEWPVAHVLREIRKTLHLTLPDLAKVGRICVPTLKNIESGASSPTLKTVENLLRPFGLGIAVTRKIEDSASRRE